MFWKIFRWSFLVTIASLVTAWIYGSWTALILCILLGILEVSLSFDNAVVNATVLRKMSRFWQQLFLTVGILIAVFGMRLIFPLLVVSIAAQIGMWDALMLALEKGDPHEPGTYGYIMAHATPQIYAFGGAFLLMLFTNYIFEHRDTHWLRWIERPLGLVGKYTQIGIFNVASIFVTAATVALVGLFVAEDPTSVLVAGGLGLVTYLVVDGLGKLFHTETEEEAEEEAIQASKTGPSTVAVLTGKAAFFSFMYLEFLDASFSFDGVIGAFAITSDPIIIALGLGLIGAMFVRSITIYLVRQGTLDEYIYLEHGAHWAIGALATIMFIGIGVHVNEVITGLLGVGIILAAFASSLVYKRRNEEDEAANLGITLKELRAQRKLEHKQKIEAAIAQEAEEREERKLAKANKRKERKLAKANA
jgi:hypothetical protein